MEMKQLMQIHPLYLLILNTQVNTSDAFEAATRILAVYVPSTEIDHFLAAWLELQLVQTELKRAERFQAKREAQNLQLRATLIQGKTGKTRLAILQNTAQLLDDCGGTRKRERDSDTDIWVQAHRLDVSMDERFPQSRVFKNFTVTRVHQALSRPTLQSL
eukprot:TRINITY_DN5411_c0_g2_i4.p1 TRINITY_DN5411_c0_g2~~TRINITY_DN5411_c0_g2_i4.p1  ORF type:complete len:160 (-),score=14.25 TRINITY_DN5411_c0_g2_i4:23-502(-)